MSKIMLVLENRDDRDFLEKVLVKLKYTVIAMREGVDLSMQLIDHFPDIVFASTLGSNQKILSALGKIKEARGKPKLVFVKQQGESVRLNPEQKSIIDGVLYSPVDPFKLIDILALTTEQDKVELRRRYNEMLELERGNRRTRLESDFKIEVKGGVDGFGGNDGPGAVKGVGFERDHSEQVRESQAPNLKETVKDSAVQKSHQSQIDVNQIEKKRGTSNLIFDAKRKSKYDQIAKQLKQENPTPSPLDFETLKRKQRDQAGKIVEKQSIKADRKHFLKTFFSMSPSDVKKKGR